MIYKGILLFLVGVILFPSRSKDKYFPTSFFSFSIDQRAIPPGFCHSSTYKAVENAYLQEGKHIQRNNGFKMPGSTALHSLLRTGNGAQARRMKQAFASRDTNPTSNAVLRPSGVPSPSSGGAATGYVELNGHSYGLVQLNDLAWMTENIRYPVAENSWYFDDDPANGNPYGMLYSWEGAREACRALGPGWRLPTVAEWQSVLAAHSDKSTRFSALTGSDLRLVMGGSRTRIGNLGLYFNLGESTYYWTSEPAKSSKKAKAFAFDQEDNDIYQTASTAKWGLPAAAYRKRPRPLNPAVAKGQGRTGK